MSRKGCDEKKLQILLKIRANKEILFGTSSEKLTNNDKTLKWKEILELAKRVGLVTPNKDWTYIRDSFWQNVKKVTMAKWRRIDKSGSTDVKLSELDEIVLDIMGETTSTSPPCIREPMVNKSPNVRNQDMLNSGDSTSEESADESLHLNRLIHQNPKMPSDIEETDLFELRKRKLELTNEHMELQNRYTKLKILKLEQELGLVPGTSLP